MNDKYTAEQIDACILCYKSGDLNYYRQGIIDLLSSYATLLRERESAKAAVTDEMVLTAIRAWDGVAPQLEYGHRFRAALEAVAPMLASGFPLSPQFVDRVTTDGEEEPPCMGAGAVDELKELADEVEACWLCASNGDGEITLETINNWSGRLSKLASARVPDGWREAYAAFKGAFDTPAAWLRDDSDFARDARKRLREFNDAMLAAAPKPESPAKGFERICERGTAKTKPEAEE